MPRTQGKYVCCVAGIGGSYVLDGRRFVDDYFRGLSELTVIDSR